MNEAFRLGFDPFVPWTIMIALAAICGLVWLAYVILRGRAWLMRALTFFVLTLALANPLWVKEQRDPLKEIVALVRDQSESMRFGDRNTAADSTYKALREKLEADDSVELRLADTDPGADGTDIYAALLSALADAPRERIGGAIVVTDGQAHDLPDETTQAKDFGPVHALVVGKSEENDRRIEIVSSPNFDIVGDSAMLTVRAEDALSPSLPVIISVNGVIVTERIVPTGIDASISIKIPRRGSNLVVAEVPEGEEELTLANNRTAVNISGVRDRLRVLLVTGEPHNGARVWRDLLKADPSVDLVHFTILRPPHKQDPTPIDELALISFPTRELFVEKLSEFDLVIFDRYRRINVLPMSYFDNMARYVADGGALLVAVGPPYADRFSIYRTPLAGILPVRPTGEIIEEDTSIRRTELGERHTVSAALEGEEQWGPWARYIGGQALSGEVVLEADDGSPLLVLDRIDQGRVATLMSDQLWMWARGYDGGGPYGELVRRTAHWLMKEPELEEELLQLRAESDEMVASLRTLSDDPPRLRITDPDGAQTLAEWVQIGPGEFEARTPGPRLGLYSAATGDLTTVALNGPANPREYADVSSTVSVFAPLADATDGSVKRIGTDELAEAPEIRWVGKRAETSGDDWIGLRRRDAYAVRDSQAQSLLPGVAGMGLVLILMMLAWRREGR